MKSDVEIFIESKIREYIRMTEFNTSQANAKELLKAEVKPLLKGWITLFIIGNK
jgi:predicted nucleotidyltransferase